MKTQEAIKVLQAIRDAINRGDWVQSNDAEAVDMAIEALSQKKIRARKNNKELVPYLMHKEMNIPLLECQKAYDAAIDYLRSQGKVRG